MLVSQFAQFIEGSQVPTELAISGNVEEWERYVVELFFNNDKRSFDNLGSPSGSLEHIWQVKLIASEIVKSAMYSDEEPEKDIEKTEIYALTHDLGRVHSHPHHPVIGSLMFRNAKLETHSSDESIRNIVDKRRRFASAHHWWGAGDPTMGFFQQVKESAYFDENREFCGWDQSQLNVLLEQARSEFGLAGLAATIADLSKSYPDISTYEKAQRPELAALTRGSAEVLIERLVILRSMRRRGIDSDLSFLKDVEYLDLVREDPVYQDDRIGAEFALKLIEFTTNYYGIDYEVAVESARDKWDSTRNHLDKLWNSQLDSLYTSV